MGPGTSDDGEPLWGHILEEKNRGAEAVISFVLSSDAQAAPNVAPLSPQPRILRPPPTQVQGRPIEHSETNIQARIDQEKMNQLMIENERLR